MSETDILDDLKSALLDFYLALYNLGEKVKWEDVHYEELNGYLQKDIKGLYSKYFYLCSDFVNLLNKLDFMIAHGFNPFENDFRERIK